MRPDSDVDVGIVPNEDGPSLAEELALQAELSRACGREVDLVRLDHADLLLRWEVARDGVTGGTKTIYRRLLRAVNKDGKPSRRQPFETGGALIVYPDGSWRYYGRRGNGVSLAREKISEARRDAEDRAVDFDCFNIESWSNEATESAA